MYTVIQAPTDTRLVAPAIVQAEVGAADLGKVNRCVEVASDVISRWCNRVFPVQTVEERFRERRCGPLLLSCYPVIDIVSLIEAGAALSAPDYELDTAAGELVRLRGALTSSFATDTVVTYQTGYADIPGAVQRAAEMLAVRYYRSNGSDLLVRSESIPGLMDKTYQDYPTEAGLPSEIEALLSDYRKPAVA